jgi:hypothetical protein
MHSEYMEVYNERFRSQMIRCNSSLFIMMYWKLVGFAPIFPDTCYHLTHYWPAAADIPVASDNQHYPAITTQDENYDKP